MITISALKDGIWISIFFLISALIFKETNVLNNFPQFWFFVIISLLFAFFNEKISLKMGRWKYSEKMPRIFGVGISPLFELVITGILTFLFVFLL